MAHVRSAGVVVLGSFVITILAALAAACCVCHRLRLRSRSACLAAAIWPGVRARRPMSEVGLIWIVSVVLNCAIGRARHSFSSFLPSFFYCGSSFIWAFYSLFLVYSVRVPVLSTLLFSFFSNNTRGSSRFSLPIISRYEKWEKGIPLSGLRQIFAACGSLVRGPSLHPLLQSLSSTRSYWSLLCRVGFPGEMESYGRHNTGAWVGVGGTLAPPLASQEGKNKVLKTSN